MQAWTRLDDGENVTQAGFITVEHKQFRMSSGAIKQADIVGADDKSGTAVIALTPENTVVVARQFRCGPEAIMTEIPGGLVDAGETPEQAARRELAEETGYAPGSMEYLGFAWTDAWASTKHHFFLARNCQKTQAPRPEDSEEIQTDVISIKELLDNAYTGKMTDAIGVFFAQEKLKAIEGDI